MKTVLTLFLLIALSACNNPIGGYPVRTVNPVTSESPMPMVTKGDISPSPSGSK